jgi:molybdopterin-guanine dinucleotide biosynthesis protein A
MSSILPICGVLLAGGYSGEETKDKPLRILAEKTLLDHALATARPQVRDVVLNVSSSTTTYQKFGLPIVADSGNSALGALSGILAAMEWAKKYQSEIEWVASFTTDMPFLPKNMVHSLVKSIIDAQADIACCRSADHAHTACGLWPVRLAGELKKDLEGGASNINEWVAKHEVAYADFDVEPVDPFFTVNNAEDLEVAETLIKT